MQRQSFQTGDLLDPAERFRREHERWLNRALGHEIDVPRIPTRRVTRGGFGRLLSTARGRRALARWWEIVLSREDLAEPRGGLSR